MDLLTYFRLRNKMTLEEWENSFEKREQEIIVLIHEGGGGSKRNGFWDGTWLSISWPTWTMKQDYYIKKKAV